MTNIKAIIFDLDGVLVNTNLLHRDALATAVHNIIRVDMNKFPGLSEISMMSTSEKIRVLQDRYKFDNGIYQQILLLKDSLYVDLVSKITINTNVIDTLSYIKSKNIKTAIASNSRLQNINYILDKSSLRNYFNTIVSAEEVPHRKPAPDILYEVYRRLEIDGTYTLFVEDTDEGAAAGHSSPSTVIRVNSPVDLTIDLFKNWIDNVYQCKT